MAHGSLGGLSSQLFGGRHCRSRRTDMTRVSDEVGSLDRAAITRSATIPIPTSLSRSSTWVLEDEELARWCRIVYPSESHDHRSTGIIVHKQTNSLMACSQCSRGFFQLWPEKCDIQGFAVA